jgi:hypothetical protein
MMSIKWPKPASRKEWGERNGAILLFERSRSIARKKGEPGKELEGVAAAEGVEKRSLYRLGNSELPV